MFFFSVVGTVADTFYSLSILWIGYTRRWDRHYTGTLVSELFLVERVSGKLGERERESTDRM